VKITKTELREILKEASEEIDAFRVVKNLNHELGRDLIEYIFNICNAKKISHPAACEILKQQGNAFCISFVKESINPEQFSDFVVGIESGFGWIDEDDIVRQWEGMFSHRLSPSQKEEVAKMLNQKGMLGDPDSENSDDF